MKTPSDEQLAVVSAVRTIIDGPSPPSSREQGGRTSLLGGVSVDAVAGSGKTSTIQFIIEAFPQLKIAVITYNKVLQVELAGRLMELSGGATKAKSFTFHGFAHQHFKGKTKDNNTLRKMLNETPELLESIVLDYDLVILDEMQDMHELFFREILLLITKNKPCVLCIFGDVHQCIYDYSKHSDEISNVDYLQNPDTYFPCVGGWQHLCLSTSYRLSRPVAEMVNVSMLKTNRIRSLPRPVEEEQKPVYQVCNIFIQDNSNKILQIIHDEIQSGTKQEEIMVIFPSVKPSNDKVKPAQNISNLVSMYLSNKTTSTLASCHITNGAKRNSQWPNKIVLTTYHSSKGKERAVVILVSFDSSYFEFYHKTHKDYNMCPNTLYVGATRAKKRLYMIHHEQKKCLPFLDERSLYNTCHVPVNLSRCKQVKQNKKPTRSISDLRFVNDDDIVALFSDRTVKGQSSVFPLDMQTAVEAGQWDWDRVVPKATQGAPLTEVVINVIVSLYEYEQTKSVTLLNRIDEGLHSQANNRTFDGLTKLYKKLLDKEIEYEINTPEVLTCISCLWLCVRMRDIRLISSWYSLHAEVKSASTEVIEYPSNFLMQMTDVLKQHCGSNIAAVERKTVQQFTKVDVTDYVSLVTDTGIWLITYSPSESSVAQSRLCFHGNNNRDKATHILNLYYHPARVVTYKFDYDKFETILGNEINETYTE